MNGETREQDLLEEIAVLTHLIEELRFTPDQEKQWAVPVLEYCLERCKGELQKLLH